MHLPNTIKLIINKIDVYGQKEKNYDEIIKCKIISHKRKFKTGNVKYRAYDLILVVMQKTFDSLVDDTTKDISIEYDNRKYEVQNIDTLFEYPYNKSYYQISCVEIK